MKKIKINGVRFALLTAGLLTGIMTSCIEEKVDITGTGILTGNVIDFTSDEYLRGAILTTNPATVSVASDSAGFFEFSELDEGDYTLIARKNNYISASQSISVSSETTSNVVVLLERSSEYNDLPVFNSSFSPSNGELTQNTTVSLTWEATDPNPDDTLYYEVLIFGQDDEDTQVLTDLTETGLILEDLDFNTTYYWQVRVWDSYGSVDSEIHYFKTKALPDYLFRFIRKTDNEVYEIFSSDSLGTSQYKLSSGQLDNWQPRLSPRGTKIAYISHFDMEAHLFTMNTDGTQKNRISRLPVAGYYNSGRGFAWSPQSNQIIYANYNHIIGINADGTGETILATAPSNRHFRDLDYSPDGTMILAQTIGASADSSEIYLFSQEGVELTCLVKNLPGVIESPVFSIDGRSILYTRDISQSLAGDGRQLSSCIFSLDLETGTVTNLSYEKTAGTNDMNPRFSPDGASIIFENSTNVSGSAKSIWIMDREGKLSSRQILFEDASMPDWR